MPLIAVDGPAASGKGTISRALARHFRVPHLDTGALYRATALGVSRRGIPMSDAEACARVAATLSPDLLDDPAIRNDETSLLAARVAAIPAVRTALLQLQREFAARPGGAVLDGRDIGTIIIPGADAKLFVTASPEVRAKRRFLELSRNGQTVKEADILAAIIERDQRDAQRQTAPLQKAVDADLLDTSNLDIGDSVQRAIELILHRLNQAS